MIFEVWGYPGSHVGTQAGPRSKKGSILTLPWTPKSIVLEAFALPFPLWGALGTLKWLSLGGFHFDITFLIKIGSLWETKNLDNMCECLQKSSFQLCQILDNFRYHFGGHFGAKTEP